MQGCRIVAYLADDVMGFAATSERAYIEDNKLNILWSSAVRI